jgi:hypothetical protein
VSNEFKTEAESAKAFDREMERCGLFRCYPEVWGQLIHRRPETAGNGRVKIDRVLVPTPPLIGHGWCNGIVGVELKRSEPHEGRLLLQALDYRNSVFTMPGGVGVHLSSVFVWPVEKLVGDVASVAEQNRIGTIAPRLRYFTMKMASRNILSVTYDRFTDETLSVSVGPYPSGKRTGNRG